MATDPPELAGVAELGPRWTIREEPVDRRLDTSRRSARIGSAAFGTALTEHMVVARYQESDGWTDAVLCARQPLAMDPAMVGLHYGQVVFEGLKAFRQHDGTVALFRPELHAARFQRSAHRLAMPPAPTSLFLAAVEALVRHDHDWVPREPERSLYLRPIEFASEATLALRPAREYCLVVLAFATRPYFTDGPSPVSVWISDSYSRAAPGGAGESKCAGNYAPGFLAQQEAEANGCDQVLWLDSSERRWVEELGGMNVFLVERDGARTTLVTPPLTGTLLPGVTRATLLTLAYGLGFHTVESRFSVTQWRDGCHNGTITESFACGTAALVTPIGEVRGPRESWVVGDGSPGAVTLRLRQALLDIQYGRVPDHHGWRHPVRR